VGSGSADVARVRAELPREQTAQRLVSLQRVIDIGTVGLVVAVEVSEQFASLDGETLDLRAEGALAEIVHVCIIPQKGLNVKEKGEKRSETVAAVFSGTVGRLPGSGIVEILLVPPVVPLLLNGLVPRGVEVVGEVGRVIVVRLIHACIIPHPWGAVKMLGRDISKKL
jgi:hypothetical protein